MEKYKFLKKGGLESLEKFERKLNEMVMTGWRVVNFTNDHGGFVVLLERIR
ncbi:MULTISPECIES: hypothetical protein [unclassified Imperialibacter]|uniref:hypothetical protein n=1 Tax=unclassified Imperialibacter TaxID=2629706 RepID=UPI001255B181|nr:MULTISPECIES: hypothetical protein [unclassified Imperialibacter]CAD5254030.1 conserved hypothetical protein [Imperialibacter sp. 75]CAD5262429.1 conserved hypothetical protein [Imperialibacter sp. 89]VVT35256.1 conserved hypothetical protein [Imperialibacter sp. EC-SDR9]